MIEIIFPADPCAGCNDRKNAVCSCQKNIEYIRQTHASLRQEMELMKRPDWAEMLERGEVIIIRAGKETVETTKSTEPAKRHMTVAEQAVRRNEILKILGG